MNKYNFTQIFLNPTGGIRTDTVYCQQITWQW